MPIETSSPRDILQFWFTEPARSCWFQSTPEFDAQIRRRFEADWKMARDGKLREWESSWDGALALVIMLDQFPLNMYRGQPESFATEAQSRQVAQQVIDAGWDQEMTDEQKAFLYMPFMHSESLSDQDRSVALFAEAGLEDNLKWANHHREIVRRFGRFPHRNAILGRDSSAEEQAWLNSDEAFKG